MKNVIRISAVLVMLAIALGCAHVSVVTPSWRMCATSLFKDIQIPRVNVECADGTKISVEGYNSTVDAVAIKAAVESVIGQAVNAGFAMLLNKIKGG